MKTINLKHHKPEDIGVSTKAMLLCSIPGYELFDSYVVMPSGMVASGKGGSFKRLKPQYKRFILSYPRAFKEFYQVALHQDEVRELIGKYKDNCEYVVIQVY